MLVLRNQILVVEQQFRVLLVDELIGQQHLHGVLVIHLILARHYPEPALPCFHSGGNGTDALTGVGADHLHPVTAFLRRAQHLVEVHHAVGILVQFGLHLTVRLAVELAVVYHLV